MAKIESYILATQPLSFSDMLIGTEVDGPIPNATKNFSLGELYNLFATLPAVGNLQQTLDAGNTAIQNIYLTGDIQTTNIKPDYIIDSLNTTGAVGEVLIRSFSGISWGPSTLQTILDSGNIATQNITLIGNITSTRIIPQNIQDSIGSIGSIGQVLYKTTGGILWSNPSAGTPSPLTITDDVNITLTLTGSPNTALLQSVNIEAGWAGTLADSRIASASTWNNKQDALISGVNIKTINSNSILGSGDLVVGGVSSVGLSMPTAFLVTNSPITSIGTFIVTGVGTTSQLIDGTGALQSIPTSLPPSGSAGGDLSGTYPNPNVDRIHGIDMQAGTPSSDEVWVYGGSPAKWQHQKLHSSQVTNDSTVSGTNVDNALNTLNTGKQNALSGTGFIKISGTTISYDNSTYLTANQTITLSGDVTGSGSTAITASISNATVTGKLLTGYVSGAGVISATDTILQAIQKLNGNIDAISVPIGANPSATIGLTAVNGSASTFMRSDGAPALNQTITPTWTGKHIFNPTLTSTGNAISLNMTTSGVVAAGTIVSAIYSNITDGFTGANTRHLRGLDINIPNAQLVFTNNGSPTTPSAISTAPSLFVNRTGSSGNSYIAFATTGSLNAGMRFNTGGNIDIGAFISGGYYPTFYSNNAEVGRFTATNGNLLIGTTTDAASTDKVQANGNLNLITAGNKIKIATGTNASIGTSSAIGTGGTPGVVTVSTTAVTANSKIFLSRASAAGTLGLLSVGTITAGSSFTITSSNILDTSTVNWWIIN